MSFILHIWDASAPAAMPADVTDAARIFDRLAGTEAQSRAVFKRLGEALWAKFGPGPDADPDDDENIVFEDDPSEWGANLSAPCPAVWNLWIATDRVDDVLPFLIAKARTMGLVVLDPQNAILSKPRPPSSGPAETAKTPASPGPVLRSEVSIKDGHIVSALYAVPSAAEKFEQTVSDALLGTLEEHGFERTSRGRFERPFPAGELAISISAEALDGQRTGIEVQVEVTWFLTRKLLAAIPGLPKNSYLPHAPSMVSPLQDLAFGSPATQDLFAHQPPGRHALVARDLAEAAQGVRTDVIPMLAAVTAEEKPWFQDPKTVMDLHLRFYLDKDQAPAGFEFVCMEDLILARLVNSPLFKELAKKRVHAEKVYAATVPRPSRWSTADSLKHVYSHTRKNIPPNPWLCLPDSPETEGMSEEQVLKHLGSRMLLVGIALALNLTTAICMVGASRSEFLAACLMPLILATLPGSAFAIRKAAKLVFGEGLLMKTVLPMTVLLPPLHLVLLVYLAWRIRAIRVGLQALLAQQG
jgi:hypothetical protein